MSLRLLSRFPAFFLLLPASLLAQEPPSCALTADVPSTEAAYRERENERCEGVYIEPVAASTRLIVRGFHVGSLQYDLKRDDELTVEVVGFDTGLPPGRLVAKSIRERHFYQMDTRALDARGRFVWDTEVLRHSDVELGPGELAVRYSAGRTGAPDSLQIWPVRVWGSHENDSPRIPVLILESETLLTRIRVRVESAAGDVVDERSLPGRSYPADRPIRVRLRVERPGAYRVMLRSEGPDGARGFTEFVAHVPSGALEHR